MIRNTRGDPARPFLRAVHLYTGLGRTEEARREFDLARNGFAAVRPTSSGLWHEPARRDGCALGDSDSAAELYGLLLPCEGLNAVMCPKG
jgi:hypothetical protein